MPFLLPAVVSFLSDASVLYLDRLARPIAQDDEAGHDPWRYVVYNVTYLPILAWIRLVVLMVPLLFHSYTGTALKCQVVYQIAYGCVLLFLLTHMVGLILLHPASLQALIPLDTYNRNNNWQVDEGTTSSSHNDRYLIYLWSSVTTATASSPGSSLPHLHELRRIWWMLVLSFVATICHVVLVLHVRSTAPHYWQAYYHNQVKPSVYFALRSAHMVVVDDDDESAEGLSKTRGALMPRLSTIPTGDEEEDATASRLRQLSSSRLDDEDDDDETQVFLPASSSEQEEPPLVHLMNEFMLDVRTRLRRTKREWAKRLEDFSVRDGHPSSSQSSGLNSNRSRAASFGTPAERASAQLSSRSTTGSSSSPSPFSILLQLYAYQDVLQSGKLDAAYDWDGGRSLTFFVPQLMSFLLHGAVRSSQELETWLLQQCEQNVYFAHRCFWFLRSWCLEVPAESATPTILSRNNSENHLAGMGQAEASTNGAGAPSASADVGLKKKNDDDGATAMFKHGQPTTVHAAALRRGLSNSHPYLDQPARDTDVSRTSCGSGLMTPPNASMSLPKSHSSSGSLNNQQTENDLLLHRDSKFFSSQERELIHNLMERIQRAGQLSARGLAFGKGSHESNASDDDDSMREVSPLVDDATLQQVISLAAVPIHPQTKRPSTRHLDSLSSPTKYGFCPIEIALANRSSLDEEAVAPRVPTEDFDKTPRFLDSLLSIADSLFHVPREERKTELRRMLSTLECEMLPDNGIYLPIGLTGSHRVWRIAVQECIPISTKERVPCILAFEVIDRSYVAGTAADSKSKDSAGGNSSRPPRSLWPPARDSSWSFLDHLPRHLNLRPMTGVPKSGQAQGYNPLPPGGGLGSDREGALTRSPGGTLPSSSADSSRSTSASDKKRLLESDVIQAWRYERRHPMRHVPLINKVAGSMKGSIDRMRQNWNDLRDRNSHILEDWQALRGSSEFELEGSSSMMGLGLAPLSAQQQRSADPSPNTKLIHEQLGNKKNSNDEAFGSDGRVVSATTSSDDGADYAESWQAMGQWGSSPSPSPILSRRRIVETNGLNGGGLPPWLMTPLDREMRSSPSNMSLPYGSNDNHLLMGALQGQDMPDLDNPDEPPVTAFDQTTEGKEKKTPPAVVFKESWAVKQERVRQNSVYGSHPGWRLLPVLIKGNDDLRQEQMASQIIYRMASILAREKVPVWLCPYDILALSDSGGIIEAIPDTISIDSLKKNDPNFTSLRDFYESYFGVGTPELADAKSNFCESMAAYSIVCFLLQIKDRHNGNIMLDTRGHVVHIDFGFFFLSSPGKNAGFESAPFKLTRDFCEVLDGPDSHLFHIFRELCVKSFLALRKHCMEIIFLVEMLKTGNEQLKCFRGRPNDAIAGLRQRFRLDLNDRACREYVNALVDDSIENWRTDWYDRYQKYFVGVL